MRVKAKPAIIFYQLSQTQKAQTTSILMRSFSDLNYQIYIHMKVLKEELTSFLGETKPQAVTLYFYFYVVSTNLELKVEVQAQKPSRRSARSQSVLDFKVKISTAEN